MPRLLLLLLLPIATAVDDPGFHALSASRTSFLGVKGSLTVNDALALKHFAEEICIVGEEGEGAEKTTLKYAEVGSYLGLSATIVAAACPRSIIFAHDLFPSIADDGAAAGDWQCGVRSCLVEFWSGVRRNGFEGRVVPMRGLSAETLKVHLPGSLDLVLVDGDRSFEGALAHLRAAWPLLRAGGGTLLVHGAVVEAPHPVRAALMRFCSEIGVGFLDVEGTRGIAVVEKKKGGNNSAENEEGNDGDDKMMAEDGAAAAARRRGESCKDRVGKKNLFLDVGSNRGDVIHAFYNNGVHRADSNNKAWRFPITPYSPSDWHVIGIEASPTHFGRLASLDYPTFELVKGAAWNATGEMLELSIDDDPMHGAIHGEWGTSVVRDWSQSGGSGRMATAQTIDLAELLLERSCPQDRVVMKMNIEGAEFVVMEALYQRGLLCRFEAVDMYWHPSFTEPLRPISDFQREFERCNVTTNVWSVH